VRGEDRERKKVEKRGNRDRELTDRDRQTEKKKKT
jgi:hypothetical protein